MDNIEIRIEDVNDALRYLQDTNPLLSVVGRCCILEMDDYIKSRPTQYSEEDVYVCESVYDESRRVIRNLPPTGLKSYEYNSTQVVADEVYYFKKPIKPQKETTSEIGRAHV